MIINMMVGQKSHLSLQNDKKMGNQEIFTQGKKKKNKIKRCEGCMCEEGAIWEHSVAKKTQRKPFSSPFLFQFNASLVSLPESFYLLMFK